MAAGDPVRDACKLFRRIPPDWIVYDENLGRYRPTSQAFNDHQDGSPMSVSLGDILEALDLLPASALVGHEGYSLASVTAEYVRSLRLDAVEAPIKGDDAHGHVIGKKTGSVRNKLAKTCNWEVLEEPES